MHWWKLGQADIHKYAADSPESIVNNRIGAFCSTNCVMTISELLQASCLRRANISIWLYFIPTLPYYLT